MLTRLARVLHKDDETRKADVWIFGTMALSAFLSLIASLVLSVEAVNLARNPDAALSCSVNEIINCASVMKYENADLFGFPNSFLGLMAEPIVITVAIAGLAGGHDTAGGCQVPRRPVCLKKLLTHPGKSLPVIRITAYSKA